MSVAAVVNIGSASRVTAIPPPYHRHHASLNAWFSTEYRNFGHQSIAFFGEGPQNIVDLLYAYEFDWFLELNFCLAVMGELLCAYRNKGIFMSILSFHHVSSCLTCLPPSLS